MRVFTKFETQEFGLRPQSALTKWKKTARENNLEVVSKLNQRRWTASVKRLEQIRLVFGVQVKQFHDSIKSVRLKAFD